MNHLRTPIIRPLIRSSGIEIAIHAAIFFLILLPVYGVALPVYYVERGVIDTYASSRRVLATTGVSLPSVEEIRAGGTGFESVSEAITAALILVTYLNFRRKAAQRVSPIRLDTVSPRDGRRYRTIPPRLRVGLEKDVMALWHRARQADPSPRLYCFAAPGVMACALSDGGPSAIAVSTGLLERRARGPDALVNVMLSHEVGHLIVGDQSRLPKAEALLSVLRTTLLMLVATVTTCSLAWTACEKLNVGALGSVDDISIVAFLRGVMGPLLFTYLGLIVMARYLSLIILLLELRADLIGAVLSGGLAAFVKIVGRDPAVRGHGWGVRFKSIFGIRVTHLPPQDRVSLLDNPERLVSPKLRYFAFSLTLPILLLLIGRRGFVASSEKATIGFQWIISAGLTGVVCAVNCAVILMIFAAGRRASSLLTWRRLLSLSVALVIANLLLFWNEYAVINRADEWLTAVLDPNFREPWNESFHRLAALSAALATPFQQPLRDGRVLPWFAVILATLLSVIRQPRPAMRFFSIAFMVAAIVGTFWERLSVDDVPFFSFKRVIHDSSGWSVGLSWCCGPTLVFVPVLVISALACLMRPFRLSRRY